MSIAESAAWKSMDPSSISQVVCSHAAATLTAQYNNLDAVREVFAANKGEIAGVILEPVVGNSGYIAPNQEFLQVMPRAS